MIQGFKDFIMRGNVVDLAVAVVIGSAFAALVASFTASFITPLLNLIGGGGGDGLGFSINDEYFNIGGFLSAVVTFLITAAVIYFLIVVPMKHLAERRASGQEPEPETVPEDIALLREIRDALKNR